MGKIPAVQKELSRIKTVNAPCITGEALTCDRTHPRFRWGHCTNSSLSRRGSWDPEKGSFLSKIVGTSEFASKTLTSITGLFSQSGHILLAWSLVTVWGPWAWLGLCDGFSQHGEHPRRTRTTSFCGVWTRVRTITAKAWASTKWASEFTDLPFRDSVIQGQSEKSIHLVILLTQEFESCALPGKSLGMSLHSLPASTHHQIWLCYSLIVYEGSETILEWFWEIIFTGENRSLKGYKVSSEWLRWKNRGEMINSYNWKV